MASIENIVDINITRQTRGVTRTGFGIPLFVSTTVPVIADGDPIPPRVVTYTDPDSVMDEFGEDSPENIVAQQVFGQQIGPNYFKIARMMPEDATVLEAVSAANDIDDDWYFLMAATHESGDIQNIASWVQAQRKLYFTSYSGADAPDGTLDTDPGQVLSNQEMQRTIIIYSDLANVEYPEAAWVGLQAPKNPGSTTWKFKGVAGVTPSVLTPTELLTLKGDKYDRGKGYNVYTKVAGRNMFSEGRAVGGEFIDVMRFSDWLEVRMRERIFLTLMNSEKLPQTREGYTVVEGRMREVLTEGVRRGGLASFKITVPDPALADPNDLANRVASGFKFKARLAGAIHFVEIAGTLTVEEV